MARILIVGGGERGLWLAGRLREQGNAARVLTRDARRKQAIERFGAQPWLGDPGRLNTLIGALENVTIACWLLGCASGEEDEVSALHDLRLRSFLTKTIDTTVRGVIYEAAGTLRPQLLQRGATIATEVADRNEIPLAVLHADPADRGRWRDEALGAIERLLARG